eukprot:XP_788568.3 PREDICTED: uncharacterized protein LOC583571 [Strongylocentrotus purpuratus]
MQVFTINQESRYLLVHGVPDINITDELLKLLSLYGVIEEYRTLDDDQTAEEFTKTHWIKYANIQAARVAKRKMDDHSFYGGFLHVSYAPESESIQHTREKLQQRRMDVARRLRKLAQERAPDVDDSIETVGALSSTTETNDTHLDGPSPVTAWTSTPPSQQIHSACHGPPLVTAEGGYDQGLGHSIHEHGNPDQDIVRFPPSLPEPPRRLPPWQWNIPSQPDFPRLRTKHDTLPVGYNPFPEGVGQPNQAGMENPHQNRSAVSAVPTGAFVGPLRPSEGGSINPTLDSDMQSQLPPGQRYRESGARPKDGSTHSKQTSGHHKYMEQQNDYQQIQTGQSQSVGFQGGYRDADSDHSQSEQRPKLVGKRRLNSNPSSSPDKQTDVTHSNTQCTPSLTSQHAFVPRPVSTRAKRSASSIDEADPQNGHQSSPTLVTGDPSFDRTVSSVREQMFQLSEAVVRSSTAPRSVIQTAIIQARNQERMGLLPRPPPTKRQRI